MIKPRGYYKGVVSKQRQLIDKEIQRFVEAQLDLVPVRLLLEKEFTRQFEERKNRRLDA